MLNEESKKAGFTLLAEGMGRGWRDGL